MKNKTSYPIKHGGTLGDLIDATDKDAISKMQPSEGQGAVSAIQDAVILSNCINDIENFTFENIQEAFTDYKSQRYKHVAMQANLSKFLGRVMFGQK
ncbi:hypothetical protein BG003_010599 [Podila horticola]|nr:hypothetical protein BG003_010599 [Podila horticola]